jgi:hypothetical protein
MIYAIGSGIHSAQIKQTDEKGNIVYKTVWFEFGALASGYTEREAKMNIFQVFEEIGNGYGSLYFLHYFYGGAVAYAMFHQTEIPDFPTVVRWVELMGTDKALQIYRSSLMTHSPKEEAPETGQQQVV